MKSQIVKGTLQYIALILVFLIASISVLVHKHNKVRDLDNQSITVGKE